MKSRIKSHIYRTVSVILFSAIISVAGCGSPKHVDKSLDDAESLMESRPDSALAILESMDVLDLKGKRDRARYALLKSMALDKNYVDTTTFEILQPAIDYYLENGTPDEKLRTYYYQGRIYLNRNEPDSALRSFMRGLDFAEKCTDSLTIARAFVAQGGLYKDFYDHAESSANYLKAANIYRLKSLAYLDFDCLLSALNCLNVLNDQERADSVINLLDQFEGLDISQKQSLRSRKMTYVYCFGSNQDVRNMVETDNDSMKYDVNGMLNLARAYGRIGDYDKAMQQLHYLDEVKAGYDTLKYLSIKYPILENLKRHEEAFAVYKDFVERLETINSAKFDQKRRSMEERHRMELQAERDAREHYKTVWKLVMGVGGLILVIIIMVMDLRSYRIKKNLALEQVRAKELENGKLKAEKDLVEQNARATEAENGKLKADKELALQKARTAELENKNLKTEKELVLEQARTAELENENLKTEKERLALANQNLKLERDNKALEAENLAHRVKELEGESESLRELLESQKEMPEEVRKAIQKRIEMLNTYLASQISDHREFEKAYDAWVAELTANTEEFMNSNRLAYQASHPAFIKYFEDHGLTTAEINYVCLYAIGLRGKDVGTFMKKRSHVNISSAIRAKLGIDRHETNIGIYVRKLLKDL